MLKNPLRQWLATSAVRQRWQHWLDHRIPVSRSVTLGHRSIFILPTAIGWLFGGLILLLLVTAINYKSSLVYGLTFWLFSIGLTTMYLTFRNLKGLVITAQDPLDAFAGQSFDVPLLLNNQCYSAVSGRTKSTAQGSGKSRGHYALWLQYPGNPGINASVLAGEAVTLSSHYRSHQRGRLQPGRILLESRFPLGLFRAWSWVKLDFNTLVYPEPQSVPLVTGSDGDGGELEGASRDVSGDQDFRGLRPYQAGDSLKQIAWKQLARGKGLVTKEFDSDDGASCWLDWGHLTGNTEYRLSCLTGWVLSVHDKGWQYGLRLPGVEIAPDHSERHLRRCLGQLALYGLGADSGLASGGASANSATATVSANQEAGR